jgi:cell division initiation protein
MKLTPLDIRHKEFKRGMRGYADVEVDEFLDEIADEYERLFKENIDLQERVESLEDKVAGYKRIEETLQKTLVSAQASAEEVKQNATKESQLILQDAELKARQMINEAYSERQTIEQNMVKLRSAEEDFRFKFKTLLEGYLRQLTETPEVTAPSPDTAADFARHAEAIKEAIARESAPAAQHVEAPAEPEAEAPAEPDAEAPAPEQPRDSSARRQPAPYVAVADEAPRLAQEAAPQASAVTPARGRGGVQAGVPPRPAPDVDPSETTMDQPPRAPVDDPEVTAADRPADAEADDDPGDDRAPIVFGESDDLLADVDTGVNENEFKW